MSICLEVFSGISFLKALCRCLKCDCVACAAIKSKTRNGMILYQNCIASM